MSTLELIVSRSWSIVTLSDNIAINPLRTRKYRLTKSKRWTLVRSITQLLVLPWSRTPLLSRSVVTTTLNLLTMVVTWVHLSVLLCITILKGNSVSIKWTNCQQVPLCHHKHLSFSILAVLLCSTFKAKVLTTTQDRPRSIILHCDPQVRWEVLATCTRTQLVAVLTTLLCSRDLLTIIRLWGRAEELEVLLIILPRRWTRTGRSLRVRKTTTRKMTDYET